MRSLESEEVCAVFGGGSPQAMAYSQLAETIVDFTKGFLDGFYAAF